MKGSHYTLDFKTCALSPRQALTVCQLHTRNGLVATDNVKFSYAEMLVDDEQDSREERAYRMWINSLGIQTYVQSLFEDVVDG